MLLLASGAWSLEAVVKGNGVLPYVGTGNQRSPLKEQCVPLSTELSLQLILLFVELVSA